MITHAVQNAATAFIRRARNAKEDLLFPETDRWVQIAVDAIAGRSSDEEPADVLRRTLLEANDERDDMTGPLAAPRLRLTREVPAVRGRGL